MFLFRLHRLGTAKNKKSSFWGTTGFKNHATTEAIARLRMMLASIRHLADASVTISNPVSALINLIPLHIVGAYLASPSSDGIFLTIAESNANNTMALRDKACGASISLIRYAAIE